MARRRFVTIGLRRSGTTVTHLALKGHPNVSGLGDEVKVAPFFTDGLYTFTVGQRSEKERRLCYGALFDAITMTKPRLGEAEESAIAANGLKVAIGTVKEAEALVAGLQTYFPEVKIVHVRRADAVARFASLVLARTTGRWHSWTKGAAADPVEAMRADPTEFEEFYRRTEAAHQRLAVLHSSHEVFPLSYERDILDGAPACYERAFGFLGVAPMPPTWLRSEKVAPPIDRIFSNVDELRDLERSWAG
ncbi:MAG: sulfotransferase [Planctomycetota bacterium]